MRCRVVLGCWGVVTAAAACAVGGCSSDTGNAGSTPLDGGGADSPSGGATGSGGAGGLPGSGGNPGAGGDANGGGTGSGGAPSSGGATATGGATSTGGTMGSGGSDAGGDSGTGGTGQPDGGDDCGDLGEACESSDQCSTNRCEQGVCLPSDSGSICGGFVNAMCPDDAPACAYCSGCDFGPCMTGAQLDCVCSTGAGRDAFNCL